MTAEPVEQFPGEEAANAPGLSRRSLLTRTAAGGIGIALAGSLETLFGAAPATAAPGKAAGYGPLVQDPAGRLSLPRGFSYGVVSQSGITLLDSGQPTPDRPDGTGSFANGRGAVLVQNHEIGTSATNPVPHLPNLTYDPGVFGGTTNLVVDKQGDRINEYVSLAGTDNNCAGGKTPWNTWLTCEETEDVPGTSKPGITKRHGYVFEVDPHDQRANWNPQPILALGRFAHEAVVVDPNEYRLYLTEDAGGPNGLFYRYTPPANVRPLGKGSLKRLGATDGKLQAMKAVTRTGVVVPDLSVAQTPGTAYRVSWVDVPDRDASTTSTRKQFDSVVGGVVTPGPAGPITRSRKLEGAWWADGGCYFVASFARNSDGSAAEHDGQVWFLDVARQTITLKIVFAYTPADQDNDVDGPDNITVSPFGGVILAEDGEGKQHLVGATDRGQTYFLARNELPGSEEFTGPNFSPVNAKVLFANVQVPGVTFAIRGPWKRA